MHQFENYGTVKAHEPDFGSEPEAEDEPGHPLDSPAAVKKHKRLLEWYSQERERQSINRYQQALDEDFYDDLQWSEEDVAVLRERGQAALVFNLIKPTINWVLGTEKRTRIDYKVLPREEDDVKGAEQKTKLLKYLSDVNKTPFSRSRAFEDAVKAGVGWLEDAINNDPSGELLLTRHESWRNILYDSYSTDLGLIDSRYLFRWKWVDLDIGKMYFPDRAAKIDQAGVASDMFGSEQDDEFWYLGQHFTARDDSGEVIGRRTFISDALNYNRRARVKLIEGWYREPTTKFFCAGDEFDGCPYDDRNPEMLAAAESGLIEITQRVSMQMRVAIFTEGHMLLDAESPYRHNRFPFTPIWCYRRGRDNAPYGMIRSPRDAQEDYNKRRSKALFMLSVNRVIADNNAVDDWDELRDEAARPDAQIKKKPGSELKIDNNAQLAEQHVQIMEQDARLIQDVGGITDENMGRQSNATSGKAILARQEQGSVVTAFVFDNLRLATQLQGEKQLSLIEQFYSEPKVIRLTGAKGKLEWSRVNEIDPVTGQVTNDITARQADFIVGEQDYRQSLRLAMFEALADMVSKLDPNIALQLLDLVVDISDLPDKEEIVARIRKMNGHYADDEELSPEEQLRRQQETAAKQKAAAMEQAASQAALEKLLAEVDKIKAQIRHIESQATKTGTESQANAVETALTVVAAPATMPAADELLQSAGYADQQAPV